MKIFMLPIPGYLRALFLKSRTRVVLMLSTFVFALFVVFVIAGYYSAFKIISYLPSNLSDTRESLYSGSNQIEIKNSWYILIVDREGRIAVKSRSGEAIMSGLRYYAEYEGNKGIWGLKNVSVQRANDTTITIKGKGANNVLVYLLLVIHKDIPKLDVRINTHYTVNTIINREALVAEFAVPVSEVYLKNRKIDRENFEPEYWLNKEGACFGKNERSALVYHTPSISSLQLETKKDRLFINLDYYLDHPYAKMPFLKNGDGNLENGGDLIDESKANYMKGSERNNTFSINFGCQPKVTPRLMSVPAGYQAGYIFTEHADEGDIRTQRAVYFGSEDISKASDAIGGFVGHKIPTTKSVFYIDTVGYNGSAIREKQNDTLLLNFLDQIYATGMYDICLHTPENLSSSRKILEEAISFMKKRYNTITWIDHGFFGGKINREGYVADGLDSNSKYYAADFWGKYDTRYFWSPAVEFIRESTHISIITKIKECRFYDAYVSLWKYYLSPRELKEMSPYHAVKELTRRYQAKLELNSLMPNLGNSFPTPLYWQHPTRTNQVYSWATDYVQVFEGLSPSIVEREQMQLNKLVNDWGIFISHGYYVRIKGSKVIIKDQKGKLIINPFFDKMLGSIAQKRDNGELFVTTIRDLLDYWIKLDNISFEYLPDGNINIINSNNLSVEGLSIVLGTNKVKINGKAPSMKKVGDDTIIWFDIQANEKLQLQVVP